jgi:hypothetical protein
VTLEKESIDLSTLHLRSLFLIRFWILNLIEFEDTEELRKQNLNNIVDT